MPNVSVNLSGAGTIVGDATFTGNVTAARILASTDGTAGAPAFSWSTDPDNGLYRSGVNEVAVAAAGTNKHGFVPGGSVAVGAFTAQNPSTFNDHVTMGDGKQILLANGAIGAPALAFKNDTDSGIYWSTVANRWELVAGATDVHSIRTALSHAYVPFSMGSTGTITGGNFTMGIGRKLILDDSTSTADLALQFVGDPNSGMYRVAADQVGVVANGGAPLVVVNGATNVSTLNVSANIVNQGALYLKEMAAPSGLADYAIIYGVVDGGSKTDLAAIFQSGAAQVFAQEP